MSEHDTFEPVHPDDAQEQLRYLRRLQWRYPEETQAIDESRLHDIVRDALKLCPALRIDDPKEVLRFLALSLLITTEQRQSALLQTVIQRVMLASGTWSATKRLNFIYQHVVSRPVPQPEPDYGPWFIAAPIF